MRFVAFVVILLRGVVVCRCPEIYLEAHYIDVVYVRLKHRYRVYEMAGVCHGVYVVAVHGSALFGNKFRLGGVADGNCVVELREVECFLQVAAP